MIFLTYSILLTFLLILASPYFLLRALLHKQFREALSQRMGFFKTPSFEGPIWIHAASVGEVFCSAPVLKRIKQEFPQVKIVLTTMTSTGNDTAKARLPEADQVLFVPIDHPWIVRRTITKIQPGLLLIAETELWPSLLRLCGKRNIPIILFNGRISPGSFRRYVFLRFFFRMLLKHLSLFLMQTDEDRARIIEIGAEPDKTRVVGNLKFDQTFPGLSREAAGKMAKALGFVGNEKVFIGGSTHPGEEEMLIRLHKELKKGNPSLVLILAPRHLERLDEVERILKRESLSWMRKTSLSSKIGGIGQNPPDVVLLDTMGELMSIYSLGTVVFIGGSLVPVGGHNPLEPLFHKKCVLFGPYMLNFLEISHRLIEAGGAIQVSGKEELSSQLTRLLLDESAREEVAEKGYQFVRGHQGATERMFEYIRPFIKRFQSAED